MSAFRKAGYLQVYRDRILAPKDKLWRETNLLCCPAAKPLSYKDEMGFTATFFIENDGIYVGVKPPTLMSNRYRMERRLYTQNNDYRYNLIAKSAPHDDGDDVTLTTIKTTSPDDNDDKELQEMQPEESETTPEPVSDPTAACAPCVIDNDYVYNKLTLQDMQSHKDVWLTVDGRLRDWEFPLCCFYYFYEDTRDDDSQSQFAIDRIMWGDSYNNAPVLLQRKLAQSDDARYVVMQSVNNGRYCMEVDVQSLLLFDHPMMSREEYLAVQLRRVYRVYHKRHVVNKLDFTRDKIVVWISNVDHHHRRWRLHITE